ncbi:MAG: sigma-70 family RNA polymerase sigma factor [Chthonomonadaceae bacterium]|nr:sigma-70 family RNA polymerase sigma factor [Chthonomonadaceae bacterium]
MRRQLDAAAEQALVDQCRRQDYEAFGKIVDAFQSRIFGFVKRMLRNDEESADVTQEVFIKAFQSLSKFDGRSSLRTWLFRIAYNLCIDRVRRSERALDVASLDAMGTELEAFDLADSRWNPGALLDESDFLEVVDKAVLELSEKLRTVLLLHDKEDLGYEEIANVVNVPVGTVKSRLFLARAHLQKAVTKYVQTGGSI